MANQGQPIEQVYVGDKDVPKYLSACFYALSNGKEELLLTARGNNTKRSIDVAAILLRQYLEVPQSFPSYQDVMDALDDENIELAKDLLKQLMTCEIRIGSEKYGERFVSTIDIVLRGKKKSSEEKKDGEPIRKED